MAASGQPDYFQIAQTTLVFESSDQTHCNSYGPISILS